MDLIKAFSTQNDEALIDPEVEFRPYHRRFGSYQFDNGIRCGLNRTAHRGTERRAGRRRRAIILSCASRQIPSWPLARRSIHRCSSPACGWPWRSPEARIRWRFCAFWRRAAASWASFCTSCTCTTACAAPRPMATWNFAGNWPRSWTCLFTRRASTRPGKPRPIPNRTKRRRRSKKLRDDCVIRGFENSCPKLRSTQWPPRTPSTIRPKQFWPNFCAERGRRVYRASIQSLKARRAQVKCCARCWGRPARKLRRTLRALGQDWREDTSNRNLTFTRNRIRHELLPLLEGWNPRLREHMTQMAAIARDEEAWWQAELARLAPQLLLPGKPARGGGRNAGGGPDAGLAIEVTRLASLAPALQRRLVRFAAGQFGAALDFAATEAVRSLALDGRAGQKLALPQGLRAERTARELRLSVEPESPPKGGSAEAPVPEYIVAIPGARSMRRRLASGCASRFLALWRPLKP